MTEAAPEQVWAWPRAVEMYRAGADFEKLGPVLVQARDEVEMLTEMAVERAAQRETWETIGRALNVSRQAAAKKYGSLR